MLGERFEEVLSGARRGDAHAFAELWRDANPMLLRYLRVSAGVLAEDVASTTWIRVIESLASFDGKESDFRRWLATIARNLHRDHLRYAGRRPERLVGDVVDLSDRTGRCAPDAATEVDERLSTDRAIRLIATLPADQAEMIMLRVVFGLEVADVAAVVGRRPGTVRVAVHRGLRKLAAMVATDRGAVTEELSMTFPVRDA